MLSLIAQQKIVEFLNEEFSKIKIQNLQYKTNKKLNKVKNYREKSKKIT